MHKLHRSAGEIRNSGILLALQIYKEGFSPTITYSLLRGGAILANVINEMFQMLQPEHPPLYAAINARTYDGQQQDEGFYLSGWTYEPSHLRPTDRVLLIDDIFDSGNTINKLLKRLLLHGIPRSRIKIVVHDYKELAYLPPLEFTPDYYAHYHFIESAEKNIWIHYSSHELRGLKLSERQEWYYKEYPELKKVLEPLFTKKI